MERKNGVFQDRLIKEMRLENINTLEEGNIFLPKFLEKHNKQFKKEAASPEDAHRPLRPQDDLQKIFAKKDRRRLSKNLTFQHRKTLYLIESKTPNRLQHAYVDVFWTGDQPIKIEYMGAQLKYKKWAEQMYEQTPMMNAKEIELMSFGKKQNKPSKHHPWR